MVLKVIDYTIVEGISPFDLQGKVIEYLSFGWQPLGGVCITETTLYSYYQAMVRYAS